MDGTTSNVKDQTNTKSSNLFGLSVPPQSGIFTPTSKSTGNLNKVDSSQTGISTGRPSVFGSFDNQHRQIRKKRSFEYEPTSSKVYVPSSHNLVNEVQEPNHKSARKKIYELPSKLISGQSSERRIPSKTKLRRTSTSSDHLHSGTSTSIVCANMPPDFNRKDILKKHFSQFGIVSKIVTNPFKKTALISFETHEAAINAKRKGTVLQNDLPPLRIFYVKSSIKTGVRTPGSSTDNHSAPLSWVQTGHSSELQQGTKSINKVTGFEIVAKTDAEKLDLLEKIDTLLRKQVVKQSDISKAKIFKGTCVDMCPEKERYQRQQRNILANYETLENNPGYVDHSYAVKEYSRSSADQEEPLPHELRPSPALKTSMLHLLINIMPKIVNGDIAEWYDFIWNRTRAIRKEISVQQLKDPISVEISEQCARFHIFCSHYFVEEDTMNFDPKINNENLEKTMKTLLDLYHDIGDNNHGALQRQDSFFAVKSNKAEFYAYYILLNINKTADVLHEIQEMSPELQASDEVRLAVDAFTALHGDNYSKFFKVARKATYLQAAILHRYFDQVRRKAFSIISRAYVPQKQTAFPAQRVFDMLCFNDAEELFNFCNHYSIPYSENEIMLSRQKIETTDTPIQIYRSKIILSKMMSTSLGDLIANKTLPSWDEVNYVPSSSFDQDDRYIGKYKQLLRSGKGFMKKEVDEDIPKPSKNVSPQEPHNALGIKSVAKELFIEVIREFCVNISQSTIKEIKLEEIGAEISEDLVNEYTDNFIQLIASEAYRDSLGDMRRQLELKIAKEEAIKEQERLAKLEEERLEKEKKEFENIQIKQSQLIVNELVLTITQEVIYKLAKDDINQAKETQKMQALNMFTNDVFQEIKLNMITKMSKEIAFNEWTLAKKEKCNKSKLKFVQFQQKKVLKKWRLAKSARLRLQLAKQTFPGAPYYRESKKEIKNFIPYDETFTKPNIDLSNFAINSSANLSLSSAYGLQQEKCANNLQDAAIKAEKLKFFSSSVIAFDEILLKITNQGGFKNNQFVNKKQEIFLKVFNYIHCGSDFYLDQGFLCWYKNKFGCENVNKEHVYILKTHFDEKGSRCQEYQDSNGINMAVCIRLTEQSLFSQLKGVSLLVFTIKSPKCKKINFWNEMNNILYSLLENKSQPIPVLVVLLDWNEQEDIIIEKLKLNKTISVSSYSIISLTKQCTEVKNSYKLTKSIEQLIPDIPSPPILCNYTFRDLLESQIPLHYVTPLYRHIAQRDSLNMPSLEPSIQINLYNSIIQALANLVSDQTLTEVDWPAPEFVNYLGNKFEIPDQHWNSDSTLNHLRDVILLAQVPPIDKVAENISCDEVLSILLKFAKQVVPNSIPLQSVINSRANEEFDRYFNDLDINFSNDLMDYISSVFPWCQLVELILSQHLSNLLYYSSLGDTKIWINTQKLETLKPDNTEFKDLQDITEFDTASEIFCPVKLEIAKKNNLCQQTVHNSFKISSKTMDLKTSIHFPTEGEKLSKKTADIKDKIKHERELSFQFEEKLKKILEDGMEPIDILQSTAFFTNL